MNVPPSFIVFNSLPDTVNQVHVIFYPYQVYAWSCPITTIQGDGLQAQHQLKKRTMLAIVNNPVKFYETSLGCKHPIFIFELFLGYHKHHPCDIDVPIEQIQDEEYTNSKSIT